MNTTTAHIEVRTGVLTALIQLSRDMGLNRQVRALDLSTSPPTIWGTDGRGVSQLRQLPTDAEQRDGTSALHKLVMMLWEHVAFDETLIRHCRVQAVIRVAGDRPLVTQLDISLFAWHLLELDALGEVLPSIDELFEMDR